MTRILVLNGSPRGSHSNTNAILTPFLEGAREAGAETETLLVKDLDVGFCRGCYTCWFVTPGICCQRDDMDAVLKKYCGCDYVVFATPLYHFGMTAILKRLLERTLPIADPHMKEYNDRHGHPLREGVGRPGRLVLLANCGFPERSHFGALVEHLRYLTGGRGPVASILIGGGEALGRAYSPGGPFDWLWDGLRQAGRDLVTQGHLSPETDAILARPLVPPKEYAAMANANFDSILRRSS
jgi:hypothetical protein